MTENTKQACSVLLLSMQTLHRQQQNKAHMASVRVAESCEQTLRRQQQNKEHMARCESS